uniref:Uncharacterized protein n=1 Tax=Leptobrachium leishanense TaxID=445787 RepID=A0A8C5MKG8_9ANUR
MCTTVMVLSTLAILLRRRFCNKVQPLPDGSDDNPTRGQRLAAVPRGR